MRRLLLGCTACHMYDGAGSSNLRAPDLTAIGRRRLGIRFRVDHLKCPACANPGSPELAIFLEASKGIR